MSYISLAQSQRYDKCLSLNSGTGRPSRRIDGRDFVEKSLARIFDLAFGVGRVFAVLADRQHGVDRQLLAAQRQGLGNRGIDRNSIVTGHVAHHIARGKLVDVQASDLEARLDPLAVEQIRREEIFQDDVGVAAVGELRENRGHLGPLARLAESVVAGEGKSRNAAEAAAAAESSVARLRKSRRSNETDIGGSPGNRQRATSHAALFYTAAERTVTFPGGLSCYADSSSWLAWFSLL